MAYNSRRSCFAAISLRGRVAYNLFEIKNASNKSGYTANLLRKSKWPDRYLADSRLYLMKNRVNKHNVDRCLHYRH